ncbi:hypothetical protein [Rhodococcus maanshanensis]|uniref:DUF8176 domain-containing protein n=1 Tax=Rhodococcus maanshanensis TaxID=183556 RepID=A0A1H7W1M6_9NOCA|nr:hypothetical protein [Rhodococcus maanshanensis]SEM15410.1 hypothetical protein SAMN05444583_12440 [Rhodococcus maanshanensis]
MGTRQPPPGGRFGESSSDQRRPPPWVPIAGPKPGTSDPGAPGAWFDKPQDGAPPVIDTGWVPPQSQPGWLRRHRVDVALGAVVAVVVAGGAATALLLADRGASDGMVSPATSPAASDASDEPVEATWCAGFADGELVSPDSSDHGAATIAGFEDAYYVARDGVRARTYVAPNALVASAEQIGQGISQIPTGTTHCLLVKRIGEGRYAVDVFDRRPDNSANHYRHTFTTAADPASPTGAAITSITLREGK